MNLQLNRSNPEGDLYYNPIHPIVCLFGNRDLINLIYYINGGKFYGKSFGR